MRKILQTLDKKGLVKLYKGKNGGSLLIASLDRIFLPGLAEIFQGKLNECILENKICPDRSACILRKKINAVEKCENNKKRKK
ncbi:unnamed protein product [marine sediment metagenome]|uniref:Rrf2 family transcriptional regulator n=1 Tax=marine sediment metagenome TaxID=412755 RepID=X1JXZ5_9ZZZZ